MRWPGPDLGCSATEKKGKMSLRLFLIYTINMTYVGLFVCLILAKDSLLFEG